MALNKENKNYYYNLGRVVAIVEIIEDVKLFSLVFDNAREKLPYHLNKALLKEKHNLHAELLDPANVVLMEGDLPSHVITAVDSTGVYAIGYYHQKSYLQGKYNGVFGLVETTIEHHVPYKIEDKTECGGSEVSSDAKDNIIEELKR